MLRHHRYKKKDGGTYFVSLLQGDVCLFLCLFLFEEIKRLIAGVTNITLMMAKA